MDPVELRRFLEELWADADRQGDERGDSSYAAACLQHGYDHLTSDARREADRVLATWLVDADQRRSHDARVMVQTNAIVTALPALRRLQRNRATPQARTRSEAAGHIADALVGPFQETIERWWAGVITESGDDRARLRAVLERRIDALDPDDPERVLIDDVLLRWIKTNDGPRWEPAYDLLVSRRLESPIPCGREAFEAWWDAASALGEQLKDPYTADKLLWEFLDAAHGNAHAAELIDILIDWLASPDVDRWHSALTAVAQQHVTRAAPALRAAVAADLPLDPTKRGFEGTFLKLADKLDAPAADT